jgi:hypothetical protein
MPACSIRHQVFRKVIAEASPEQGVRRPGRQSLDREPDELLNQEVRPTARRYRTIETQADTITAADPSRRTPPILDAINGTAGLRTSLERSQVMGLDEQAGLCLAIRASMDRTAEEDQLVAHAE